MRRELILDRIEEGTAVLTDKSASVYECSALLLPEGANDGASLYGIFDENGNITSLEVRTVPVKKQNRRKLGALFAKNPKNKNKL